MGYWLIFGFLLFALILLVIELHQFDKRYHRERFSRHLRDK